MTFDLNPCRYCGSEDGKLEVCFASSGYFVHCIKCEHHGPHIPHGYGDDAASEEAEAVRRWNTGNPVNYAWIKKKYPKGSVLPLRLAASSASVRRYEDNYVILDCETPTQFFSSSIPVGLFVASINAGRNPK